MIIVMMGPPGAGKGTQSARLQREHGLVQLSTGDMLRDAVDKKTDVGVKAKGFMDAGQLVPDQVVIDIIAERIDRQDCENGFILDGFPRTIPQAEALDGMLADRGREVHAALELKVVEHALVERVVGRFFCCNCGTFYHDQFNLPKVEGVCDVCGSKEFGRRKDDDEATVRERFAAYRAKTAPVLPYYQERGLLKQVDGLRSIAQVAQQIDDALGVHNLAPRC